MTRFRIVTGILCVLVLQGSEAQTLYFPPLTGDTWETVDPVSLGWCVDRIDSLTAFLGSQDTKAFIVLKGGRIAIEAYFGNFTQDSLWYWASAGKSLTAALVGIAQADGDLSIDDPVSDYLGTGWTSCPADKESLITIRHQLTMTSGLDDGVSDNYCTLDTCLLYAADAGSRWAYHNAPYTLLDGVIEYATGQTLNAYYLNKMRIPTGMNGFFIPSGYNNLLLSNARSMARFGLLALNEGYWGSTPVISDPDYFADMTHTSQTLNQAYGYLWWLNGSDTYMLPGLQWQWNGPLFPAAPPDLYAALGKNGQIINVVPSEDLVVIRMGNVPGDFSVVPHTFTDVIWQYLNQVFCNTTALSNTDPSDIEIYPNPCNEVLYIAGFQGEKEVIGDIYDLTGRRLASAPMANESIRVDFLLPGHYMLCLRVGEERFRVLFQKK